MVINTLIGKKLLMMIIVGKLLKGVYQTHLCSWYFPFPYFQSIPLQASGEFSQASRHSCSLSTDGSGFPPITWLVSNTCHPSMHPPPILKYSKNLMTSSNGNIFRVIDPLCGEFTGYRWIPLTKASDADLFAKFALIWSWTNGSVNNRDAGDLRRHRANYYVTVISSM